MRVWEPADAGELSGLVDVALPGEALGADEVVAACFEDPDPSVVLSLPEGEGAVAVVVRGEPGRRRAHLVLLAVAPAAQGRGRGRQLLAAAEAWAFDGMGAEEVVAGGCSPFGLWPGVDVRWTRSLCLFESAGYRSRGTALVWSCPSTHRATPPAGVEVRRVLDDRDAAAAIDWAGRHLPVAGGAVGRGVEQGGCFVAVAGAAVVGVVCHSVNRAGWIGPIGVAAEHRRWGIGRAMLGAACADLRATGLSDAYFGGPGPVRFLVRATGASVSRVFLPMARRRRGVEE
jgi:GNAT superfamily N-acetyltransferase